VEKRGEALSLSSRRKGSGQISRVKYGCIDVPRNLGERRFDPEKCRVKMSSSSQDQEVYHLRLDDHEAKVSSAFRKLRNDTNFCDVSLVVKDKTIPLKAHKMILSSCSPYFKDLFKEMKNNNLTIMMRGVTSSTLNSILDYMYYGEVSVAREDLNDFLKLAEELQVKGLVGKKGLPSLPTTSTDCQSRIVNTEAQGTPIKQEQDDD